MHASLLWGLYHATVGTGALWNACLFSAVNRSHEVIGAWLWESVGQRVIQTMWVCIYVCVCAVIHHCIPLSTNRSMATLKLWEPSERRCSSEVFRHPLVHTQISWALALTHTCSCSHSLLMHTCRHTHTCCTVQSQMMGMHGMGALWRLSNLAHWCLNHISLASLHLLACRSKLPLA